MAGESHDWPCCPGCGVPRLTRCPVCGTAGREFIEAEPEFLGKHHRLLICPTCDEPFPPEYAKGCEWCSHEFGDGFIPEPNVAEVERNPAFLAAAWALAAAVAAALIYIATLL